MGDGRKRVTNEEEKAPQPSQREGVGGPTLSPALPRQGSPSRRVRVSHANNSVRAGEGGGRAAGGVTAIGTGCAADFAPAGGGGGGGG